jgi:hypothetical protein
VGFVADINARSVGMYDFQAEVFALDLARHLASLLAVHLVPMVLRWMVGGSFVFLLWLGFHANLPVLNSTWLGPVGENYTISPAGSGRSPFQDKPAAIYTIARTGAMLSIGQERSRENAALAAEPGCASDFS